MTDVRIAMKSKYSAHLLFDNFQQTSVTRFTRACTNPTTNDILVSTPPRLAAVEKAYSGQYLI